jgi:hypothetical protein
LGVVGGKVKVCLLGRFDPPNSPGKLHVTDFPAEGGEGQPARAPIFPTPMRIALFVIVTCAVAYAVSALQTSCDALDQSLSSVVRAPTSPRTRVPVARIVGGGAHSRGVARVNASAPRTETHIVLVATLDGRFHLLDSMTGRVKVSLGCSATS